MKIIFKDDTVLERKDVHLQDGYIAYSDNHKLKGTSSITSDRHFIPLSNIKEIIEKGERNPDTQF